MQALTSRQQQILNFIQLTHQSAGVAPSLREIAREFGFRSMTAAADHVRALRRKGYLVHHPRRARAHAMPAGMRVSQASVVPIPLYGAVTADGSEPPTSIFVDLDALGARGNETLFAIQVHGQSLEIVREGDLAILDWAANPAPGNVVAWKSDAGYTLGVFNSEPLSPSSDNGSPLPDAAPVAPMASEAAVAPQTAVAPVEAALPQGVLVGLIRRYR